MTVDYYELKGPIEAFKQKARYQVKVALKNGILIMPDNCQHCGIHVSNLKYKVKKLQAHHTDYNNPLEIVWVCFSCHRKIHRG